MPKADPPLAENCHPVGASSESAVRLTSTSLSTGRRLSEFSRGDFLAPRQARGEMRSD